jgi:cytochrome c peroxidase
MPIRFYNARRARVPGARRPPVTARAAAAVLALLPVTGGSTGTGAEPADLAAARVAFGQALFFDVNLSGQRTQSCASCHDPARAFADGRDAGVGGAVSPGADGRSLGDRNTPSTAYAAFTPPFRRTPEGHYVGGFFHDGRAATLAAQAREPILNPREMAMPDTAAVVARVAGNPLHVAALLRIAGRDLRAEPARAFEEIAASLAAFEQSAAFAPFDSRYDRFLRGEETLTPREEIGRSLFFSPMTNCASCHMSGDSAAGGRELFTNFRYHNIGVPANAAVRRRNGLGLAHRDPGLLAHPDVDDPAMAGKFKVPSLRNVAVTAPYMHNGVFRELRTAIHFYNQYTVANASALINPETGQPWGPAEFPATIDAELLAQGQPLDEARIDALVAFLATLTDRRYEPLLKK